MFYLTWRTLFSGFGWQVLVAALIFYCIGRAIGERKHRGEGKTLVVQKPSWTGRIGAVLGGHVLLSLVNGIVGYNVLISIFCMVLSLPLMIFGAKVHLPEHVKAWPRSVVARVKESLIEKERAVADKLRGTKDAVVGRIAGRDDDDEEEFNEGVPMSSDEFWGGPTDSSSTPETWRHELLAFDAMPPKYKLLALAAATPREQSSLPGEYKKLFAPAQWLNVRVGRSTAMILTAEQVEMHRMLWTNELHRAHGMDARTRVHLTRISTTPRINPPGKCRADFGLLPPAERVAIYDAAVKCIRPLPDSVRLPADSSRDAQFYEVRTCSCSVEIVTHERLESLKKTAEEEMREADIVAAMEGTQSFAARLKSRAARYGGALKSKAARAGGEMKERAEEGAKGLFWKALGY